MRRKREMEQEERERERERKREIKESYGDKERWNRKRGRKKERN